MPDLTVVRPAEPSALERLVDDYLLACRAKGLSPNTIDNSYGYPLRGILLPWCAERGVNDLAALTSRTIDAFSVYLMEQPGRRGRQLSRASVHAYIRSVRGFLTWCEREGEAVTARPSLPKLPRRVLDVLDREEIKRLVAAAPTERDRLILSILADCGLRAAKQRAVRAPVRRRNPTRSPGVSSRRRQGFAGTARPVDTGPAAGPGAVRARRAATRHEE